MTDREPFVARWLRLKRQSGATVQPPPAERAVDPSTADQSATDGAPIGTVSRETEACAPAAFDPASLPPLESITAASDMSPFLQAGVPAELMRAALRSAWIADPRIRNFVGIAESQWDFNDPNAMPGFGPLQASERGETLLAQAVSRFSHTPDAIVDLPPVAARPEPAPVSLAQRSATDLDARYEAGVERDPQTCGPRHHGGAMPK